MEVSANGHELVLHLVVDTLQQIIINANSPMTFDETMLGAASWLSQITPYLAYPTSTWIQNSYCIGYLYASHSTLIPTGILTRSKVNTGKP